MRVRRLASAEATSGAEWWLRKRIIGLRTRMDGGVDKQIRLRRRRTMVVLVRRGAAESSVGSFRSGRRRQRCGEARE